MPLPGGPSDKAGNSYERRWTVFALIDLLEGKATSLRIEVPGEDGAGSEFRLIVNDVAEWHQAKRQRSAGSWTISAMLNEGFLRSWRRPLQRGDRCVFVSSTSADELRELADRAVSAESWAEFSTKFLAARSVRTTFDRVRGAWPELDQEDVFNALSLIKVSTIGEPELARWIEDRLRALVTGASVALAASSLAQLADDSVHRGLTAQDVWAHLAEHGIAPFDLHRDAAVVRLIAESAESYLARHRPLHIGGQELQRNEEAVAWEHLDAGRRTVLAGAAGAGKSVVASHVVASAMKRRWPVLVLSADRMPEAATTTQLGVALGLPESPATVLAAVAAGGDALLVIDQLDAVSAASGRHPERLDLISDLLREAASYPRLRVMLACRQFDIDNDRALRAVIHEESDAVVRIDSLNAEQLHEVLTSAGLDSRLPAPLMRLLALPLHCAIYVELARAGIGNLLSARTLTQLFDSYWNLKRDACLRARGGTDEWNIVIQRLVDRMNSRQELSVPTPVVDDFDQQIKVMASEGVLARGQGRISFFHETFFDYCFARRLVGAGQGVRVLLTGSEQNLFRRAQVRQLFTYERDADATAYLADLNWVLGSTDVRLHIKAVAIALLETVADPSNDEWQLVRSHASDPQSVLHLRLWQAVRNNCEWFPVLDDGGDWATFLKAGGELASLAIWALSGCAADFPARVVQLVEDAHPATWPSHRRRLLGSSEIHRARELVDLLLTAIAEGDFDTLDFELMYLLRQLAQTQPVWGVEVLSAFIQWDTRAGNNSLFDAEAARHSRPLDFGAIRSLSLGAPEAFVRLLLPAVVSAIHASARAGRKGADFGGDALWSFRGWGRHSRSLSDGLYEAMGDALALLASADPERASIVFGNLRAEPYESAAFLLASGYAGNPTVFADEAARWIATTPDARLLGYTDSPSWKSRELIAAITPHCSMTALSELIDAVLHYAPPFECTHRGLRVRGLTELGLLNGIEVDRRSPQVVTRLGELSRKFNRQDVDPPIGVRGGAVPPPVPADRAKWLTDRDWLSLMERYDGSKDIRWREGNLVGDASDQAHVLESLAKENPRRFGLLFMRLRSTTAQAYTSALLRGLAAAGLEGDQLSEICKHAQHLGGSEVNRWLVHLIEAHATGPLDHQLIEVVAQIAATDPSPPLGESESAWGDDSIDSVALNSTRSAAAMAIGQLLTGDPGRLRLVEPALRHLIADPHPAVRAASIAALTTLMESDPDNALAMFHVALLNAPATLFGSHHVLRFLQNAIRYERYADVAGYLQAMLAEQSDAIRQVGARQVALASLYDARLDATVDGLLASSDIPTRAAAIEVFADNITYRKRRDRTIAVLSSAFSDEATEVRNAAERAFYELDQQPLADYTSLISSFARSPAMSDGASIALHTLESSRFPLPVATLEVCERFLGSGVVSLGDVRTAAAGVGNFVVRLTLRMHAQYADPSIRERCLDLIDRLVVLNAMNVEMDLDSVER